MKNFFKNLIIKNENIKKQDIYDSLFSKDKGCLNFKNYYHMSFLDIFKKVFKTNLFLSIFMYLFNVYMYRNNGDFFHVLAYYMIYLFFSSIVITGFFSCSKLFDYNLEDEVKEEKNFLKTIIDATLFSLMPSIFLVIIEILTELLYKLFKCEFDLNKLTNNEMVMHYIGFLVVINTPILMIILNLIKKVIVRLKK
jgi:hypothetical protein